MGIVGNERGKWGEPMDVGGGESPSGGLGINEGGGETWTILGLGC